MTSTFLLHLSSDSIDLERADASGHWRRLGSVSMDSENLTKALAHLRQTAVPGAADALEVLVALPIDQIKLLDLDHSDTSSAALQHALAGQTPYEFHELCVDRLPTPQGQSLAAIAQETLDEADSLTKAFGFKAVGYVALPGGSWGNNFSVFQRPGSWHPKPAKALYRSDPRGWSHGSDAPCGPERGRQFCAPATHRKSHLRSLPHARAQRRRSR